MPKSPGYSSITNSFPSTVLPAGFFTTPRRTFRVFLMKKAEGEKIISGTYIATIFKGNISTNRQSYLKEKKEKESPKRKVSFETNMLVIFKPSVLRKWPGSRSTWGKVKQLNFEIEHPVFKSWSQTTTKNNYKQNLFCQKQKIAIRDRGSTALYTAYTV